MLSTLLLLQHAGGRTPLVQDIHAVCFYIISCVCRSRRPARVLLAMHLDVLQSILEADPALLEEFGLVRKREPTPMPQQ